MCVLLGNKLLLSSCLISFFVLAKISSSLEWITLLLGWSGSDSNKHPRAWTHHPQKTMTHICLGRFCCFCWVQYLRLEPDSRSSRGCLSQTNSKAPHKWPQFAEVAATPAVVLPDVPRSNPMVLSLIHACALSSILQPQSSRDEEVLSLKAL